ncbi:MAG: hypothetical protein AAFQ94_19215 [Bacteroidota bacterium]
MIKYLAYYFGYTFFIFGVGQLISSETDYIHDAFTWMMLFFLIQSLFIAYLHFLGQKDPQKLPLYFFGALVFRMLTMILMLGVIYIGKVPDHILFTINSGIIYLLYLTFEIILLLVNLRPNSEENG